MTWWAVSCPDGERKKRPCIIATGQHRGDRLHPDVRAEPHPDYPDTVRFKREPPAADGRAPGMSMKSRMEAVGLREPATSSSPPASSTPDRGAERLREILVPGQPEGRRGQESIEQAKGPSTSDLREQVCVSCRRCHAVQAGPETLGEVAELALSLFGPDGSPSRIGEGRSGSTSSGGAPARRRLLISMQKHHKHSHYIIPTPRSWSIPAERLIVAGVSRYHREGHPGPATRSTRSFPRRPGTVSPRRLLRIADALRQGAQRAVRAVECRLQTGCVLRR